MTAITVCPRCRRGQILRDLDGVASCLQCGFTPNQPVPLPWIHGHGDYPARSASGGRLLEAS